MNRTVQLLVHMQGDFDVQALLRTRHSTRSSQKVGICELLALLLTLFGSICELSGAPFQNLDFEQANTNSVWYDQQSGLSYGPVTDLLPGWEIVVAVPTGYFPGVPGFTNNLESISFNSRFWEGSPAALFNYNPIAAPRTGEYSLLLESRGVLEFGGPVQTISLSQTAELPLDASGLRSDGVFSPQGGVSRLTLNGVLLERDTANQWLDISSYAGQTVELRLDLIGGILMRIDGFYFVPEPSTQRLLLIGCLAIGPLLVLRQLRGNP